MADATKPDVLMFYNGTLAGALNGGLKMMKEKANVHEASYSMPGEPSSLLRQFPSARAIWIVDTDIVRPQHRDLSIQVMDYVKNRGGIAIVGGPFASFVGPNELNSWIGRRWRMPWRVGQYRRTTTVLLQDTHVGLEATTRAHLVPSYRSEAWLLKHVPSSDSLYASPEDASSEPEVFGPVPVGAQTAIAFGKCGQGWLGYIGDVDNQEGTAEVLLAMMGLLA